jgi:short-subunit dehydrogenase
MGKDEGGEGGVLVNMASITGLAPSQGFPIYSATKHGSSALLAVSE